MNLYGCACLPRGPDQRYPYGQSIQSRWRACCRPRSVPPERARERVSKREREQESASKRASKRARNSRPSLSPCIHCRQGTSRRPAHRQRVRPPLVVCSQPLRPATTDLAAGAASWRSSAAAYRKRYASDREQPTTASVDALIIPASSRACALGPRQPQ